MAGENEFGGLQSGEDSGSSLKYSYEDYLADNNDLQTGFPTNKDNLTDTDYQQGNEFTNYNGGDDYAIDTSDNNDSPDEDDAFDDGYDDEADDSYDDEDDYDDEVDDEEDDEDDEDDDEDDFNDDGSAGSVAGDDSDKKAQKKSKKKGDDKKKFSISDVSDGINNFQEKLFRGVINWKPGEPITLALLTKAWGGLSRIQQLQPLIEVADVTIMEALNATGPNIMIRFHRYLERLKDPFKNGIGCLLTLISSNSQKLLYTSLAAVEAIFDQQWLQVGLIVGLSTAFEAALELPVVKKMLEAIFTVGVPIINLANMKRNVNGMVNGEKIRVPKNEQPDVIEEIKKEREKMLKDRLEKQKHQENIKRYGKEGAAKLEKMQTG